ncbi:MAG TPA: hypothetical protein VJQ57_13760 [Acidimicrobiia bacterium]|nr:hypothetical protein [Acidimicrobiia bacterium]
MKQKLGAQAYQTFQILAPKETHTVPASCEEVECQQYARGWMMKIDLTTDLGQKQAYYIKHHSGRSYTVTDQRDGLVTLTFRSGQPCFQKHRKDIERDPLFRVKGGDKRGNPLRTATRVHKKPEFWVEEFAENQQKIADAVKEG